MPRTTHRTPRHLDEPLRLGPLTMPQWGLALGAAALAWLALRELTFLDLTWRLTLGATLVGLALSLTASPFDGSLTEWPRRVRHALAAPREFVAGPPRRGPTALLLVDERVAAEEPPDA